MLSKFKGRNVLLLQGPVGPFFRRLATELEQAGATVTKINFNAGDTLFYLPKPALFFRGNLQQWPGFLEKVISDKGIQDIFLFGDCRPYHRVSKDTAKTSGIQVYVFEEGYLRPDYITMENGGVNGNSKLPKDPSFYLNLGLPPRNDIRPVNGSFVPFAFYSGVYALSHTLFLFCYPKYTHHRNINFIYEAPFWLKSAYRKAKYRLKESEIQDTLCSVHSNKFFLVALQVHLDSQLQHTVYEDISDFIGEVVASFARYASSDHFLVFKHHPLDRGYRDYTNLLRDLGRQHGISNRVIYVHDLHLPTLLKHALGTVMMNSTVGISSIHHGTPVKVMGRAVYDLPGLTFQGSLDEFWSNPGKIDKKLFESFVGFLQRDNQPNGNFYVRLPDATGPSGIDWSCLCSDQFLLRRSTCPN